MENGCEFRTVIHRKFVDPVRLLGLRISVRIGATDKPENRGHVPFGSERPKILAGRGGPRFPNAICAKMSPECIYHPFACVSIIDIERTAIERRDHRWEGVDGGGRVRGADPLN